ncbi:MAG: cysteine desulfurase [Planctomycetaceae bacterium]|nr:cysteine desulfurase [Planctomycetaceae bacterium]
MTARIYLDNAATTPPDPRVIEAAQPFLTRVWGNPSSLHQEGREAREAVDVARRQVAELIGARREEIVFTGSGTEADNMAIQGVALAAGDRPCHVVVSAIEHPAVLECCRALEQRGVAVELLPVNAEGIVDPADLERSLRPETRLVSVMAANNVLGTLQPVAELAGIARRRGVLFHTDAVQAAGKTPINVQSQQIDLLSLSAHKLHGPKGIGALYVRDGVKLPPLVPGGGQEGGRRSGTENVAAIVAFGRAAEIARLEMASEAARLVRIRDFIIDSLSQAIDNSYLIGHRFRRLPGHICLGFEGMEGEAIKLLLALDEAGVAVSSGSACSSNHAGQPSHVLQAIGFNPIKARGSLRITLGRFNTMAEAERLMEVLPPIVRSLRPMHGMMRHDKRTSAAV